MYAECRHQSGGWIWSRIGFHSLPQSFDATPSPTVLGLLVFFHVVSFGLGQRGKLLLFDFVLGGLSKFCNSFDFHLCFTKVVKKRSNVNISIFWTISGVQMLLSFEWCTKCTANIAFAKKFSLFAKVSSDRDGTSIDSFADKSSWLLSKMRSPSHICGTGELSELTVLSD